MPRLRYSDELNNELNADLSVGGFPTETYMPRGERTPLTRPSSAITAEAISRVAGPIGRRPAARDGNELALPHHVGEVASHRPLANASHPLANRRSWKRAITSNEIVDDALYLSTSTAASGPTDGPASLHARCGTMNLPSMSSMERPAPFWTSYLDCPDYVQNSVQKTYPSSSAAMTSCTVR